MFHYHDGALSGYGLLSDQAWMIAALLDLHAETGDRDVVERAEALAASMQALLWDPVAGGYWDLPADQESTGLLRIRLKPFTDNAVAAIALMRLAGLTGRAAYRESAERTLMHLATVAADYKHYAAPFGVALDEWFRPPEPSRPA